MKNLCIYCAGGLGKEVFDIATQRDFLLSLGIEMRRDALLKNASVGQKGEIKSSVERLISPDEMGTLFKVLAMVG